MLRRKLFNLNTRCPRTQVNRIPKIRLKRQVDRISSLPDDILVDIISRLDSTEESVTTGSYSRRWQNLWTQAPNLLFEYNHTDEDQTCDFYAFVMSVLSRYGQSQLKKFKLDASFVYEHDVYSCISYAIDLNVQELDIKLWNYRDCEGIELPDFFFTCPSFIHLKLFECYFEDYIDFICWKNLKTLEITFGRLDEDVLQRIISRSPVLETLVLNEFSDFEVLDIVSNSVKNLVICGSSLDAGLQINAPHIESLKIKGDHDSEFILLVNISSVIEAELDFDVKNMEHTEELMKGLILSMSHVKEIKVGKSCLQVLSNLKSKGFICPSNLKVIDDIDSN